MTYSYRCTGLYQRYTQRVIVLDRARTPVGTRWYAGTDAEAERR